MAESRKRRFLKRVLLTACGAGALVVSYLAAYGAFNWNGGKPQVLRPAFAPLHLYEATDYPRALTLHTWRNWCLNQGVGNRMTWEECSRFSEENRQQIVQHFRSRIRR